MTVPTWLTAATDDARRRDLPELVPLLEGLAKSTAALRTTDFNDDASGGPSATDPEASAGGKPR